MSFAVAAQSSSYPAGKVSKPMTMRRKIHSALGPRTGSQYSSTYRENSDAPAASTTGSIQGTTTMVGWVSSSGVLFIGTMCAPLPRRGTICA